MAKTSNQIDKEAVRLLAVEHGVREAARMLNLSEDRVRKWSSRYNWLQSNTPSQQSAIVTSVTSPAVAHSQALAELKQRSTLNLARYAAEASEQAVNQADKLRISRKAVDVATVHRSVWPQEQNQANILQIGFLISDDDASQSSEKTAIGHVIDEPSVTVAEE